MTTLVSCSLSRELDMNKNLLTVALIILSMFVTGNAFATDREVLYAFDADYPPHTYLENGKPVGFDIEILNAIFRNREVSIVYKPMQWAEVQDKLKKGEVHITSGMAKTEERMRLYRFTDLPVSDLRITLFTTQKTNIKSLKDLMENKVATQRGSLYQTLLEKKGVHPVLFETEAEALLSLAKNESHAFAGTEKTAFFNIKRYGLKGVFPVSTPLMVSSIYYVIRNGDETLLSMVNEGMERIRRNGTYDQIYRKWFVEEVTRDDIVRMLEKAKEASFYAYAPYSSFNVGAAVLAASGKIYSGCNIENAILGYSATAIKVAVYKAISEGEAHFKAVLNLLPDGKTAAPAPDERQIIHEFGRGTLVVLDSGKGGYKTVMISELLPYAFQLQ
jgi:glutamine transport system substrate-binding protein